MIPDANTDGTEALAATDSADPTRASARASASAIPSATAAAQATVARLWRTLQPLPAQMHAFRAINVLRQRVVAPLLPVLVTAWRLQGAQAARRARDPALLNLGAALAAAPAPKAEALRNGRLHVVGRDLGPFPPVDWALPGARALDRYEVHYLDWAEALVAAGIAGDEVAFSLCEQALAGWNAASSHLTVPWEPFPRARRCLAALRAAARLTVLAHHGRDRLRAVPRGLRHDLLAVAGTAAAGLGLLAERHLDGNHLLVDRLALAAAEAVWGDPGSRRGHLIAAIAECERQFPGDGGHVEASPMYHAALLEDLLVVQALVRDRPLQLAKEDQTLASTVVRATGWLAAVRHPDGRLPAFGDSDPDALVDLPLAATALGRTPPAATDATRSVWTSRRGGHVAIVHTAPPAWTPQPGHAHADHLSIEWSHADRRILADAGLAGYEGDPHRALNRSEASHSTVAVAGQPSIELWATFRVGARGQVGPIEGGQDGEWDWVGAVHESPQGFQHVRLVAQSAHGALVVGDGVVANAEGPLPTATGRLLLAPGVAVAADKSLVVGRRHLQVQANVTLVPGDGLRFSRHPGRSPGAIAAVWTGPELRYSVPVFHVPLAGPGPGPGPHGVHLAATWLLLGPGGPLAAVRDRFAGRWHLLASHTRVG